MYVIEVVHTVYKVEKGEAVNCFLYDSRNRANDRCSARTSVVSWV